MLQTVENVVAGYGVKLVADMKGDTSGDFERIVVSMCTGMRDERGEELGEEQATAIAQVRIAERRGLVRLEDEQQRVH